MVGIFVVLVYKLMNIVLANIPIAVPPMPKFFQGVFLLVAVFGPWLAVLLAWLSFSRRIEQKIRDRAYEIAYLDAADL
jgi:hypothetical protein